MSFLFTPNAGLGLGKVMEENATVIVVTVALFILLLGGLALRRKYPHGEESE